MKALEKYKKRFEDAHFFNHYRATEAEEVDKILQEHFTLERLECIETGCSSNTYDNFGLYMIDFMEDRGGGIFSTVDISPELIEKSRELLGDRAHFHCGDSVEFLRNYQGSPTLVHLDSWDLDVIDPMPSMLHCWLEFDAIRNKMPVGGIVMIDDNYFKDTQISWHTYQNGKEIGVRDVAFDAEVVGKGSLIYHWIKNYNTDWIFIGDRYSAEKCGYTNAKILIKKV
jgi:hypothetical protein